MLSGPKTGTGLVHTAPGHGQEDYQVGQRCGLPLLSPVDDAGRFTAEAGPFAGLSVQVGASGGAGMRMGHVQCLPSLSASLTRVTVGTGSSMQAC